MRAANRDPAGGGTPHAVRADDIAVVVAGLNTLETYQGQDIQANLVRARALQLVADRAGETELSHRARLVQADMAQRNGDVGSAAREYLLVHRHAQQLRSSVLQARSHFHLALTHHYLGDRETSLEHAVASVELLGDNEPVGLRIMFLIRLANALVESGAVDAARDRYREAERLAVGIGDLTRQLLVLNNLAYTESEAGELDEAWEVMQRMRAVVRSLGRDFLLVEQDTVANIHIARGEYAEAVSALRAAMSAPQWYEVHDHADATLTLATALRGLGDHVAAQDALDRCQAMCDQRELISVRVRALAEQAELSAATGDFRGAFEALKRYNTEADDLRSIEREARARTRQVMFETAEARREAERYREQARRDALTGLYNRRYADENLPALIVEASRTRRPLTVALVDLDFFKRINDTLSHETGDRVLITVADVLASLPVDPVDTQFVARFGGEEFLLVQMGADADRMASILETLRSTIRSYPWAPITGALPVTVSVGAVTTPATPELDVTQMLAEADRNLYEAKGAGRDRVALSFSRPDQ